MPVFAGRQTDVLISSCVMKDYDFTTVNDKNFWLDGGSMFGIVPRVIWERFHPADERHRILIATKTLVARRSDRVILCDLGMGEKLTPEFIEFYSVDTQNGGLYSNLEKIGIQRADITDVFFTHLHFDHTGCATVRNDAGDIEPAFPNATYYVQKKQFDWAKNPIERDDDSYNPDDFRPLFDAGKLKLLEGDGEILDGVSVIEVAGHTPGMQLVKFDFAEKPVVYCGDLFPLASHVRAPWVMAYDLHPIETVKEKKRILDLAERGGWALVYEHDPEITASTIQKQNKANSPWKIDKEITLEGL